LIEVLVAVAIFGSILAAGYACWNAVVRGSKTGMKAAADVQRDRVASRAIQEALVTAVMFTENLKHYYFLADTAGDTAYLSFVSRLPESFPGAGIFGDLRLRRLTFWVDERQRLIMTQAPVLLATNADQEPYSLVLATNVSAFLTRFWDTNANDWVDEWAYTNAFPPMMDVALAFGGQPALAASAKTVSSTLVKLPAMAIPQNYQVPISVGGRPPPGRGGPGGPGAPGNVPGGGNPRGATGRPPAPGQIGIGGNRP
jgi:prepilin-type N-terminal cleavage/methylation domain-containing protein